ncbi:hypothetical protein ACOMHN_004741 [Nucella lapillus]
MEWQRPRSAHFVLMILIFGLAASRHCDHQYFWDSRNRMCRPCAKCPKNEIIRKACGRHTDTVCGPFSEFNFFNQLEELDSTIPSYDYESFFDENSSGRAHVKEHHWGTNERQNEPIVQKDDGEYWKNLAFALIGVVCVLIFVATIVVLMACRKLHETAAIKRPDEDEDDDSGYVVIRAIRPPHMTHRPLASSSANNPVPAAVALLGETQDGGDLAQDADHQSPRRELRVKGTYKPKRRLLNYDADDVFESEDSSGSRTSRKLPLQAIPERSVSSDSDNANVSVQVPV